MVVASLADVVRSKEAAGREKDRVTLPTLRRLLERLQNDRPPDPLLDEPPVNGAD